MTFVRERAGVEIMRKHAAARAVLKALRDGEMVGIPFDQNAKRSEAVFVPFFGEPAATTSGLARLVAMSRRAGGSGLHRARARQAPPSHRDSGRDSDSAQRRCRRPTSRRTRGASSGDRGHGAPLSRAVPVDASALPHPSARDGRRCTKKPGAIATPAPKRRNKRHRAAPLPLVPAGTSSRRQWFYYCSRIEA